MPIFVLDTSVIVKWYRQEEELADKAILLRAAYFDERLELAAPDYLLYEFVNVMRYKSDWSTAEVFEAIESFLELNIRWVTPDAPLLERGVEIARSTDTSLYDAIFVATAQAQRAKYVTADKKFVEAAGELAGVQYLGDVGKSTPE